jgi:hypothetical protein
MNKADLITNSYLFRGIAASDLSALARIAEERALMAGNLIYDAGQDSGAIFIIEMGADDVPKPEYRAQQYLLYSFLVSETHRVSSLRGGINRADAFASFLFKFRQALRALRVLEASLLPQGKSHFMRLTSKLDEVASLARGRTPFRSGGWKFAV